MNPLKNVIVTRHAGALRWLTAKGITGETITHVSSPDQVRGKRVVGVVPLHLAAEAAEVLAIVMPELPPEMRGRELTAEEMETYGARLMRCAVIPIVEECYPLRGPDGPNGHGPIIGRGKPFGTVAVGPLFRLLDVDGGGVYTAPLEHIPACGEPRLIGVSAEEADAE